MDIEKYKNKWGKLHLNLYRRFLHTIGFTKDKTSRNLFRLFQFALYAITIVFVINLSSIGTSGFGEWGDFFGGVLNPILTFLTFMGLLITIILQQTELKQSRKEFQGQKEALENQEFDNKFFQMLNLFNNVISNLEYGYRATKKSGREVFSGLKSKLEEEIKPTSHEIETDLFEHFNIVFKEFNNNFDRSFKYYFINLYQILKYIDGNNAIDAKEYTNILRAQLSKDELVLLFYNTIGVIDFSKDKYKKMVEKYAFFEHLRYEDIADMIDVDDYRHNNNNDLVDQLLIKYEETAFGENITLKEKRQSLLSR